jgi:hypothetical protein
MDWHASFILFTEIPHPGYLLSANNNKTHYHWQYHSIFTGALISLITKSQWSISSRLANVVFWVVSIIYASRFENGHTLIIV